MSGTGVSVYYNSSITILNIQASNVSANNNVTLEDVVLPDGVLPTADRPILMPIMGANWYPTDQIAYLNFGVGKSKPVFRIKSGQTSISNAVLVGCFAFPTGFFTLPVGAQSL